MTIGELEATNELMTQYEPMVHSFLRNTTFKDPMLDYDTAAQDLRLALVRATKKWDPEKGAQFITYVYMAMLNAKRTLQGKAVHHPWTEDISEMEITGHYGAEEPTLYEYNMDLTIYEKALAKHLVDGRGMSELRRMVLTDAEIIHDLKSVREIGKALRGLRKEFAFLKENA
jgi:hypothetical protein